MLSKEYVEGNSYIDTYNSIYEELSDEEKIIMHNIFMIKVLIHECEHARQHKIVDTHRGDFEQHILELSLYNHLSSKFNNDVEEMLNYCKGLPSNEKEKMSMIMTYSKVINNNFELMYQVLPSERMAEINACIEILKIYYELRKNTNQRIKDIIEIYYMINLGKGYTILKTKESETQAIVLSPILTFHGSVFSELSIEPEVAKSYIEQEEAIGKDLDIEDRMYYGFKITSEEYKNYEDTLFKKIRALRIEEKESDKSNETGSARTRKINTITNNSNND